MTGNTAREGLDNPIGTAGAFSSYITGAPVVLLLNLLER